MKPELLSFEPMMYEFWKTDEGYVLCVQIFQGVAGDRIVKIRVPAKEALELRVNSDLLRLKVDAVGRNPGLFENDLVDFTSPESAPAKPR